MRQIILVIVVVFAFAFVAAKTARVPLYEWVQHPKEWVQIGRAPADQSHRLAIALPTNNFVQLEEKFWAISDPESPTYRKFMSFKEIEQLVDPGVEVTGPVLAWLHSEPAAKISHHGDFIKVEAPVSAIERLFATEMHVFKHFHTGKLTIRHVGKTSIPASAARHVQLVEGLHEFPRVKAFKVGPPVVQLGDEVRHSGAFPFISNNVPQSQWTLYNIPNNTLVTNPKATQGVFAQQAADGIPQLSDLAAFDQAVGIPVQTYTYNGANDTQTGGEASLDLQMITSIAQNANTTFFMQQAWMYMFTTDLLSMGDAAPLVISVSYGWAEAQECSDILHDIKVCKSHGWNNQQYINNTDIQFMKFGASGRTFVVCSQDEGAPGETNNDCSLDDQLALYPEYPASSPYVTTVGATAILGSGNNIGSSASSQVLLSGNGKKKQSAVPAPCDRFNCTRGPQTELPCYMQNAIFTTGGGFSQLLPQPSYQQAAVAHYLASNITIPPSSKFNRSNRGYPDIGAIGQNVLIVMGGQWQVTGGTSASTPIVAGVFTLINNWLLNNNKPQLGFVNPLLYRMAAQQPNTFNKVTQGANRCTEDACCKYGFEANPDGTWNPATGLGSPNYLNILSYLQKNNL